ncbi:21588_t:CDS:1 [Cetraspora pellucida]|uniref:21588_t:CDS:1 n=1 Tax=Cetraspora pellucida TaxID=1433469 RepID=A0A9N9GCL5_9GLOM|nr:21588_t:CDS:1 [Cetraspora pellucida]
MASTLHLPRPRSAASSVKSVRSSKSVRSTSPSSAGGNRDENDALRPYVDAIVTMFVRIREKGYNFSAVTDCIEEEIGLKKHEPTQIFSWLLSNRNTAQYVTLLGFFYFQGIGVPTDQRKGFSLFLSAAKMDFFVAQDLVADCYAFGLGTTKNEDLSFMWYQKASQNGSVDGQFGLGYCYEAGIGTVKSITKAFQLYKKSSKKENRSSMFMLAQCYEQGTGTTKDLEQAIYWYRKAKECGNSDAETPLEELLAKTTNSE